MNWDIRNWEPHLFELISVSIQYVSEKTLTRIKRIEKKYHTLLYVSIQLKSGTAHHKN